MRKRNLIPKIMNDLVKFIIIVLVLIGIIMLAAGEVTGRTMGGILVLWGVAGWSTVREKR